MNSLATRSGNALSAESWEVMKDQATTLIKSGFLPKSIQKPEQAIAIAVAGKELGVPMMQAFRQIHVINGQVATSVQLMLALARRTGELEDISIVGNEKSCSVSIKRKGQTEYTSVFTMADANKMGLLGKYNWKSMPGTMLQWRALSANLRITFPDAISGVYTAEELGAEVDQDGNPVGEPVSATHFEGPPSVPAVIVDESGEDPKGTLDPKVNPKAKPKTKGKAGRPKKKPVEEPKKEEKAKPEPDSMIKSKVKKQATTTNFAFLEEMGRQKARVGDETYYRVMRQIGFKHANEVLKHEDQTNIWYELKELPNKEA